MGRGDRAGDRGGLDRTADGPGAGLGGADLVGALGHGHGSFSSATACIEAVGFPTVGRVTYVLGETLGAWWDRSDG
ncbi:hypothetical protein GCM10011381_23000 [Klenkia taihuensis]|nr:hypothetical protein GCM10011381_23000 [Klenkia taihuensis]